MVLPALRVFKDSQLFKLVTLNHLHSSPMFLKVTQLIFWCSTIWRHTRFNIHQTIRQCVSPLLETVMKEVKWLWVDRTLPTIQETWAMLPSSQISFTGKYHSKG